MTQHYTRNTVEASSWCNPCGKNTPHAVAGNKIGACLTCLAKRQAEHDALQMKSELYEERSAILEFDAHFSREEAQRLAHEEIFGKLKAKQERLF